jgi:ABC-type uncharacterized transport system permease subunit
MRKDFFDDERELIFPTDSSGLYSMSFVIPRLSLRSNLGLKLANAFGVNLNLANAFGVNLNLANAFGVNLNLANAFGVNLNKEQRT